MATKDELIVLLAKRRFNNFYVPNLTRVQIRQAAQQLTDAEWDSIIANLFTNKTAVGDVLAERVRRFLMDLAIADITAQLADDLLTTDELLELI